MFRRKIGRRKFIKGVSAALLGAAAPSFLNVNPSSGKPGKPSPSRLPNPGEDRTQGDGRGHGSDELQRPGRSSAGL